MALCNTDDEETMPMYTPKMHELVPEPAEHPHPLPELDPRSIAPDGVATPRTRTEPMPLSWIRALVAMALVSLVACGPSTTLPGLPGAQRWDQLEGCFLFCDQVQVQCGDRPECYDTCGGAVERVTDECRPLAVEWYRCMREDEDAMNCSAFPVPLGNSCEDVLRDYHDCQFGGEE